MRKIWITFQRVGFHRYPAASSDAALVDVGYLGNEHRHLFKFKVTIQVYHGDREIEFHQFLNWIESLYVGKLALDNRSCEMMADDLHVQLAARYPGRFIRIEVSEDGECGAEIDYPQNGNTRNG